MIDPSYNDVMKNFADIRTPMQNILKKIIDSIYSAISTRGKAFTVIADAFEEMMD